MRDDDKTGEIGASESLQDERESPWAITFNGLVQELICVLASD